MSLVVPSNMLMILNIVIRTNVSKSSKEKWQCAWKNVQISKS